MGYINTKGDIIIPAEYNDISYFNEDGYAYGIMNNIHCYKFDINGNKEEISFDEYVKGEKNAPKELKFDENIKLVKQVDTQYEKSIDEYKNGIYKEIINLIMHMIPVVIHIIISIIVLVKICKKDKKEDVASDDKKE